MGRKFVWMAYYNGLKHILDQPHLNGRHDRWLSFISENYFEVKHIKGKDKKVVDALSMSMQFIHLEAINIYESDMNSRIK